MLFKTLLTIHIIAGFTALAAAFTAIVSKTLDSAHSWHVYSGRIYSGGMVIIFLTAIPMSILHPSSFLFLIALFSFYLALAGWRLAKNRRGTPHPLDWGRAGIMLGAGRRWTAKLRATTTAHNRLLLKTYMGTGHAGASGQPLFHPIRTRGISWRTAGLPHAN